MGTKKKGAKMGGVGVGVNENPQGVSVTENQSRDMRVSAVCRMNHRCVARRRERHGYQAHKLKPVIRSKEKRMQSHGLEPNYSLSSP